MKLLFAVLLSLFVTSAFANGRCMVAVGGPDAMKSPDCQPPKQEVRVLIYHRITETFPAMPTVISTDRFREHLDMIKSLGYSTVTVQQAVDFMNGKIKLPEKSVAITFDDGWKDHLVAAKELSSRGMSATFYVLSGLFHDPRYLSEAEILQISLNPKFEIGAHSHTHMIEYEDKQVLDTRVLVGEMVMSRAILERIIQRPVRNYAWPYGAHTAESVRMAASLGFTSTSMVSQASKNKIGDSPMELTRLNIDGACTADQLKSMLDTGNILECK